MSLENAIARMHSQNASLAGQAIRAEQCEDFSLARALRSTARAYHHAVEILREEGCIPEPEPRYTVQDNGAFDYYRFLVVEATRTVCACVHKHEAHDYADYLNKKESKDV